MADLFDLVDGRRGHFLLESGLHSELWLDLDPLFADQRRIAPLVTTLSSKLRAYEVEAVCGALVGGAFLAQLLAQELEVEFCYTEKKSRSLPSVGTTALRGRRRARNVADHSFSCDALAVAWAP